MKKFASIIGVGVLSMAVGFAQAFAQQTKPMDNTGSTTTVQLKTDEKAQTATPSVRNDKTLPGRPAGDSKSSSVNTRQGAGVSAKSDTALPAKTGTDVKNESVPAKSGADMKTGSLPGKSQMGAKDDKASAVRPGADLKSEKAVRSHHAMQHLRKHETADGKLASSKAALEKHHHAKTASVVSKDADKKAEKGNTASPSTIN
jgi:hypothetical protein